MTRERTPDRRWPIVALAAAYPAWLIYGSLFPLAGWNDSGFDPWLFFSAGLPRYWTGFDFLANLLLYVPLGFIWGNLLARHMPPRVGLSVACLAASLLSLSLEVLQHWLPSRVPSNLDWAFNTLGAMAGGLLAARFDDRWRARVARSWDRLASNDPAAVAITAAVGAWALIQLSPETVLFGSGLAHLAVSAGLGIAPPEYRQAVEAIAVGLHVMAIGALARTALRGNAAVFLSRLLFGALVLLSAKALVSATGLGFAKTFDWLTPGALWGLAGGAVGVTLACALSGRWRAGLASIALLAGSAALFALPPSPYGPNVAQDVGESPLRNVAAAIQVLAVIWPVWALAVALRILFRFRPRPG